MPHRIQLATRLALLIVGVLPALAQPTFSTIFEVGSALDEPPTALKRGALYGGYAGGIYKLTPPTLGGGKWHFQNLNIPGGISPMLPAPNGGLYVAVGNSASGTICLNSPPSAPGGVWTQTVLHTFTNSPDGAGPTGSLVLSPSGSLYGTTGAGGQYGFGTVYQLTPPAAPGAAWTEAVLYSFAGLPNDGAGPAGLVMGSDGSLFGPANGGSSNCEGVYSAGCGVIFNLAPPSAPGGDWQETAIYMFKDLADGAAPAALVVGPKGELYGVTSGGGSNNGGGGTAFELVPPSVPGGAWSKTTLFKFTKFSGSPPNGLVLGLDGNLYGTAVHGGVGCKRGKAVCGTVFELMPPALPGGAWKESTVHDFLGISSDDGANPLGGLSVGPDGTIYGVTSQGGKANGGTVFMVRP